MGAEDRSVRSSLPSAAQWVQGQPRPCEIQEREEKKSTFQASLDYIVRPSTQKKKKKRKEKERKEPKVRRGNLKKDEMTNK